MPYFTGFLAPQISKKIGFFRKTAVIIGIIAVIIGILADNNIDFDDVKTYDIQLVKKQDNSVVDTDFITFASASGVNTFFDGGAIISDRTSVVCIGEITAEALESHGVNSFKIAKTKDTDGILKTIIKEVTLKEG